MGTYQNMYLIIPKLTLMDSLVLENLGIDTLSVEIAWIVPNLLNKIKILLMAVIKRE